MNTFMKDKNKVSYGILVAVILLGGIYWYYNSSSGTVTPPSGTSVGSETISFSPSPSPTASPKPKSSSTSTKSIPATDSISYSQALVDYASKRIQLDPLCQANPSRLIVIKGTKVMFDNRSAAAHTIALDGVSYSLGAYSFRIISVTTSASLPHTVHVDCGSGKNVAQIDLQG